MTANAGIVDVHALSAQLQSQNSGWVAKDNFMNQKSLDEIRRMLGVQNPPKPGLQFKSVYSNANRSEAKLPVIMDWRSKSGQNYVSPILDQGNCGSCVAFATIGTLETQFNISSLMPFRGLKLSPQNLFACGGGACDFGWQPESAAQFLQNTGVVDESCLPYSSGATGQDVQCSACSDSSQRTYKISGYKTPTRGTVDLDLIKQALQDGPLVTTMVVSADFLTYSSGVYKHTSGDMLGGHAVSIVGYDDKLRAFIVRNSWGPEWGVGGFVYISYDDDSGIGSDTWQFDLPAISGAVALQTPSNHDFVSGNTSFTAVTNYSSAQEVILQVTDAKDTVVWTQSCSTQKCTVNFPSSQFADGEYHAQALARNAHGQWVDHSDPHYFYVANTTAAQAVTFQGDPSTNTDLTKPLSGRIQFLINTQSTPIPLSSITFHYKGPRSDQHESSLVTDPMTLGWRTTKVPNGTYEIWFTAHLDTPQRKVQADSKHMKITIKNNSVSER